MTEPETPGSDPTQLRTRAVRDGDGYVLDGHKWFTSNGSIADFLVVMAVTDPDAAPHERASMFLVPVDTPGVNIVRDVPNMEHPYEHFGMLGGHTEILYEDVRLGPDALLGKEGEGFLIAQHRLVPGRIHHCMRWLGVARRAFDMLCERSLYRPVRGGLLKDKQTVQNWIADSAAEMQAARLMTLHAAWKIDQFGSSAARTRRLADQVLRREGAARRRRPRAAAPRRARLLDRHAARDALPLRPPRPLRRRRRRGAPRVGRAADPARVRGARGRHPDRARADAPRCARRQKFADVLAAPASRAETVRAVQLVHWQAEPELREVAVPEPGPGEVLVKITAAGLCHSDLHIMEWPEGTLPWTVPFTLGHENAGTVAALGDGVDRARGRRAGRRLRLVGLRHLPCNVPAGAENRCFERPELARRRVRLVDGAPRRLPPRPLAAAARLERWARPRRRGAADRCCADALPRDQAELHAAHARLDDGRDRGRRARPHGRPDPAGAHADADRRASTRGSPPCDSRSRAARTRRYVSRGLDPADAAGGARPLRRDARPRLRRHRRRRSRSAASLLGPGGHLTLVGLGGGTLPDGLGAPARVVREPDLERHGARAAGGRRARAAGRHLARGGAGRARRRDR